MKFLSTNLSPGCPLSQNSKKMYLINWSLYLILYQFSFRENHSTIDQARREIVSSVVLDKALAFDKVWHKGLIHKLKSLFKGKVLQNKIGRSLFWGRTQDSELGLVLYLVYSRDISNLKNKYYFNICYLSSNPGRLKFSQRN